MRKMETQLPQVLQCYVYTFCTTALSNLHTLTFRRARTKYAAPKDHAELNSSDSAV